MLDDKKIRLLTFRADYRIDTTSELEFQLGYNGGDRQEGSSGANEIGVNKRADNHFEMLHWRRALEGNGELSVQFYHATESSFGSALDLTSGNTRNGDVIANRYDLEVQHTFSPGDTTRMAWGGSVRYDKTYAPVWLSDNIQAQPFHLARLFGTLEWRARSDLIFNLGAMSENNSVTGTDITPRMAVNWHLTPEHTLRLGNSTATRTPTVRELSVAQPYLDAGILHHTLQPERINSTEIGYLGSFTGLKVDFRLFRDKLTDLIAENASSVRDDNLNSGRAVVKGFETQLKWDIGKQTRVIYSLSHIKISSRNEDRMSYTNGAPTNSQSLMLTHKFDHRWSTSLVGYQVGETHLPEVNMGPNDNPRYFIDSYRRWDGRIAYSFRSGAANGELALIVQNLADAHYFEYSHDNEFPGRTAWINLKLDF
ncbi:MAG: TonB-dependent receptor plug domain-containing protein [Betaproteobacteria bacterium]